MARIKMHISKAKLPFYPPCEVKYRLQNGVSTKTQAKDQRKQLHMTEIELAILRQLVLDLKAGLQKVKDVARVAKEASEVAEMASYEQGVQGAGNGDVFSRRGGRGV